jgi:uroporphyrinogen-III synthase
MIEPVEASPGRTSSTLANVFARRSFRVLVTRPRGQASALAERLEAVGATPILIPTIEIAPPSSYRSLDSALAALRSYDWLIFTSANAVAIFAERARSMGLHPHPRRIAVIGPATARAVQEILNLPVDHMPARSVAEDFAESLLTEAAGASILIVRAVVARDVLATALKGVGARVTIANAYTNIIPEDSLAAIQQLFATNPPDAITFTSASTAQNLRTLLGAANLTIPAGTVLASIGPITSQAMREVGLEPTVEAPEATIPRLVAALLQTSNDRHQTAG